VLKVLTPVGIAAGELTGAQALRLWNGAGAVRIHDIQGCAMLMDWLSGPSLADMARAGQDLEAAAVLAQVALKLRRPAHAEFGDLKDHYAAALETVDVADVPEQYRAAMSRARTLWQHLVNSTQDRCLLHADLHHENVLHGDHGWCAIDPKGVNGDPCYEFANAFRNPKGFAPAATPDRILALAKIFATHTGLNKTRILQFGFAHVALSLAWNLSQGRLPKADLDILLTFDKLHTAPLP
jgi:streptomycin 6-kinase